MNRPHGRTLPESNTLKLGDILEEFDQRLGVMQEPEILTLTERMGFVSQRVRFNKRLAISDTSDYKLIGLNDIAFNPYLLWAGAVAQNTDWETAIISPLYPTFHVKNEYSPRFVNYLLCSGFLRSRYWAISFGSIPRKRRATVKDFLDLRIPQQPPLAEQERIVKLLDETDELRKLRVQADRRTADLVPALFHDMFGDPISNPKGWSVRSMGEFVVDVTNGLTRRRKESEAGTDIVLRLRDVRSGWIDYSDVNRITLTPVESSRYLVSAGDLLFIRVNGNPDYVGRCAVFAGFSEPVYFNDHIMRVKVQPSEMSSVFLAFVLNSAYGKREIALHRKTSAGQHTINQEGLSQIQIPVPPLDLQRKFATRVTDIRAMEAEQAAARRRLDDLFQSMLHRAFQGKL